MAVEKPVIIKAVAGEKNKASVYNKNFDEMVRYVEESVEHSEKFVNDTVSESLSIYSDINILPSEGEVTLTENSVNTITPTGNVNFVLPKISDNKLFYQIVVMIDLSTMVDINVGTNYYYNQMAPEFDTTGNYELIYVYDNLMQEWACTSLIKGVVK